MNFAVGVMGVKVSQLVQGDSTDRSNEFPKGPVGDVTKQLYQFVRQQRIRVLQLDAQLTASDIMMVAGLEWTSSPKAALRQIAKASSIYGGAKVVQVAEFKKFIRALENNPNDSPLMQTFKTGMRDGFGRRFDGGRLDSFTPFLIFLARLEDIYHHIDQNVKDVEISAGPLVVFKTEDNNLIYQQRLETMGKAAEAVAVLSSMMSKEQEDVLRRLKGLGSGSG